MYTTMDGTVRCQGAHLAKGHLLGDVAVAIARELGALPAVCVTRRQADLTLALVLPVLADVLTLPPFLPILCHVE